MFDYWRNIYTAEYGIDYPLTILATYDLQAMTTHNNVVCREDVEGTNAITNLCYSCFIFG